MAAIGVFDSGVGGLSVLREVRRALPGVDLLYVADSGHAPYGERSESFIAARVDAIGAFFRRADVQAIVVACNTASAVAVQRLRAQSDVPVVAIEPAIKPAAQATRSGVIGVLATQRTIDSAAVAKLINAHGRQVRVLLQACTGWVELVESGELSGARTEAKVARHLKPLLEQGADTLVLGCTHFPFLRDVIARLAGPNVDLIDPAPAVARELVRRLSASSAIGCPARPGTERFWSSGSLERAHAVIGALWGARVPVVALPA